MAAAAAGLRKVGWIGTGVMGRSMCKHILDKMAAASVESLSVFSRTESKLQELLAAPYNAKYQTPEEMAADVDVLVLMVGYPQDVKDVMLPGGRDLLNLMRPNTLLIDHTTSSPSLAREISDLAKAKNIAVLDAPVSGGDMGARNGALSVMSGCDEVSTFESAKPIIDTYAKTYKRLGNAGAGQHCKMGNQVAIAGAMIGVCESLLYAQKAGLDPELFFETIRGGAAASASLELYTPRVLNRDMEPGFYVKHFVKDMEIALDECRRMNLCLPGLGLVHQLYRGLMAQGDEDCGTQALVKVLEQMNGGLTVQKK